VGLIDIMPTILKVYHIDFNPADKHSQLDGCDLMPVIKGKVLNRPVISSITSGFCSPIYAFQVAIIKNNHKIIYNKPYKKTRPLKFSKKVEFYDLLRNPAETINLYLRQMPRVRKFQGLLDSIIARGMLNLNKKGKKVIIDKKMQDELKALGYL
jgi:hypothetical protein